jgi:hypothetical protein
MNKLERQITAIINDQGGVIPMDFFVKTLRQMVDDGKLKVSFPENTPFQYKHTYEVVKGAKE